MNKPLLCLTCLVSNCAECDSFIALWKLFRIPSSVYSVTQMKRLRRAIRSAVQKLTDYCDEAPLSLWKMLQRGMGRAIGSVELCGISFFFSRYQMKSYEFGGALRAMGTAINEKKESAEVNRLETTNWNDTNYFMPFLSHHIRVKSTTSTRRLLGRAKRPLLVKTRDQDHSPNWCTW